MSRLPGRAEASGDPPAGARVGDDRPSSTGVQPLDNNLLIIAGSLDGASGFILSMLMSKASELRPSMAGMGGEPRQSRAAKNIP